MVRRSKPNIQNYTNAMHRFKRLSYRTLGKENSVNKSYF